LEIKGRQSVDLRFPGDGFVAPGQLLDPARQQHHRARHGRLAGASLYVRTELQVFAKTHALPARRLQVLRLPDHTCTTPRSRFACHPDR
jgi:hypothetical protein